MKERRCITAFKNRSVTLKKLLGATLIDEYCIATNTTLFCSQLLLHCTITQQLQEFCGRPARNYYFFTKIC